MRVALLTVLLVLSAALAVADGASSAVENRAWPGDANCDDRANSVDAAFILQLEARLIEALPCPEHADVTGDDAVDSRDAALVLQSDAGLARLGPPRYEDDADAEADDDPDLPGEYVDLPELYGGPYPATAEHAQEAIDYGGQGLPPAGGPHWGRGVCPVDSEGNPDPSMFCGPAPWGIFREPWPAEVLVHNMEHGGVVIWYHTDDEEVVARLEDFVERARQDDMLLVLAPYPGLEHEHVALTSWSRRDVFPVDEYSASRIRDFVWVHERRFNPEGL